MDATVEALRNCVVDDVHLGIRFADLLETLTSRLRNRFIQAPTMQQTSGKGQSPSAEGANGAAGQQNGDAAANWVNGHAQKLREGLHGQRKRSDPGLVTAADGPGCPDPAGSPAAEANNISATPFDLSTGNFPYPGVSSIGPSTPAAHVESNATATGAGVDMHMFEEWNNPGNEMWYLPTGPAFFQNMENSAVAMTAEGVNVGGLDLLEYMAMDPVQFSGVEGSGTTTGAADGGGGAV